MYKLVIVDDETAIRKGMCNYISWNEMGFEVVADFEDGAETMDYISRNSVDVILTDIEMAQVNGLALARHVYQSKLPVKVVILSGYKEFEYAREALEYNVQHYLLKPIRLEEVQKVFGKIKDSLDQEKIAADGRLTEKKRLEELLPQLQEQFWISLLVGEASDEKQIDKRCSLLHLDLNIDKPCAILNVQLQANSDKNFPNYEKLNSRKLIDNIFSGDTGNSNVRYYPVHLLSKVTRVIAVTGDQEDMTRFEQRLKLLLEEKAQGVFNLLKLEMNITIDKLYRNIVDLDQNKDLFELHPTDETNKDMKLKSEEYEQMVKKYKLLSACIKDADFEELYNQVDAVFNELGHISEEQMKQFFIGVFSMISNRFMKMGDDLWLVLNEIISYRELSEIHGMEKLRSKCKSILRQALDAISKNQNENSKNVIEQAAGYMKDNYGEDLSLEYMANRWYLNHSYFSRLFKQYTGSTFTEYLIQLRMEKAKELLATGKYKVYEVSTMVGYKSEKYFFSIFKKYSGSSPAEYYRSRAGKYEQ